MTTNLLDTITHASPSDTDIAPFQSPVQKQDPAFDLNSKTKTRITLVRLLGGVGLLSLAFGFGWLFGAKRTGQTDRITLPVLTQLRNQDEVTVTAAPVARRAVQRFVEAVGTLHGFEEITRGQEERGQEERGHRQTFHFGPGTTS